MDKDHILEEIRRTAAENGGVPLGIARFYKKTGIKQTDWLGKFWARWNDVLQEAGFGPNQLRGGETDEVLLEKYAQFAHELGRLPTASELNLRHRSIRDFPNKNAFSNRFGRKSELTQRLLVYCREHAVYDDVAHLCEAYVLPPNFPASAQGAEATVSSQTNLGFVYLIKSGRFYKIGRSNASGRRGYEIGLQLPERAIEIHAIRTDDPSGIEAYWHKRFETKRKNGEWFDLSSADVAVFRRREFM